MKKKSLGQIREIVSSEGFKERHRSEARYFSRVRILTLRVVIMMILRKGMKSLQLALNEVLGKLSLPLVSKSAYSQARQHLKHTAFIELNREGIVKVYYEEGEEERFWGMRVLGIDGSNVILPDNKAIYEAFGKIRRTSGKKGKKGEGYYSYAQASVLYDVLNKIAIDSLFAESSAYEVDLAEQHLAYTQEGDLLVCDRNYASYRWLATLVHHQRGFVIRCQRNSFKPVQAMFAGEGADSQIVTLSVPPGKVKEIRQRRLPNKIKVRLIRVTLSDGSYEVLVTNLLDEKAYPTADFSHLYQLRWGVETFYQRLKTRLTLENFSGYSVEAVKQDFFAAVFLTGLETILTQDAQAQLRQRSATTRHTYQVNNAVAFNAIKNHAFELLFADIDIDVLLDKLTKLFLTDPSCIRPERRVPHRQPNYYKRYVFHRHKRKDCF